MFLHTMFRHQQEKSKFLTSNCSKEVFEDDSQTIWETYSTFLPGSIYEP